MTGENIKAKILPLMVLAPSAHNTQPWNFSVRDNVIDVYLAPERHLKVSDPIARQAYISLGCTIFNGQAAAAAVGSGSEVLFWPEGEKDNQPVARINLGGEADQALAGLAAGIKIRRNDRRKYDGQPLTTEEKNKIPTLEAENVFKVNRGEPLEKLAKLTGQGSGQTLLRKDFKEELSHWVRNNWTKQTDGMPGYAMGMPALISLISPIMVKIAPIHKQEQTNTAQQIASASLSVVIFTAQDSSQDWLKAGLILEKLWLEATLAGLSAGVLAAAIEADKKIRAELASFLNIPGQPQSVMRIGHGPKAELKASPRRSVVDCLK